MCFVTIMNVSAIMGKRLVHNGVTLCACTIVLELLEHKIGNNIFLLGISLIFDTSLKD